MVRRLGLYGRYRSSSSVFSSAASILRLQFGSELSLLLDRGEDSLAPVFEFAEIFELLLDVADLDFVEVAGDLLAVARDERDGRALRREAR